MISDSKPSLNLNFDNTAIAFEGRSKSDLQRAVLLFRTMHYQSVVNLGSKMTLLAFRMGLPVKPIIKETLYKQFCGGEDLQETLGPIQRLAKSGVRTILDYGLEGKEKPEEIEAAYQHQLDCLRFASSHDDIPCVSCKVTAYASNELLQKIDRGETLSSTEEAEKDHLYERMRGMAALAAQSNTALYVDAEESWIQQGVDELVDELQAEFNKEKAYIYHTVQMYRHDRLEFLKKAHERARGRYILGVKVVRGAYMEKERERAQQMGYEDPIQVSKAATDEDYDRALMYCLDHVDEIAFCAATHNEASSMMLAEQMHQRGIDPSHPHIWFSQLYGMSDHMSFNLARAGYNATKYVPYGPVSEVIPYLIRRAQENTSVSGSVGRELSLLLKELQRRKNV